MTPGHVIAYSCVSSTIAIPSMFNDFGSLSEKAGEVLAVEQSSSGLIKLSLL